MEDCDDIYKLIPSLSDTVIRIKNILTSVSKKKNHVSDVIDSLASEVDTLVTIVHDLDTYEKLLKQELQKAKNAKQEFSYLMQKLILCENVQLPLLILSNTGETSAQERKVNQCEDKLIKPTVSSIKPKATIPAVSEITDELLMPIPGYMKGRLKTSQINDFITKFNHTIQMKYKILRKPQKTLTSKEKEKTLMYKEQVTAATKGFHFCTSEDLKEFSNLNLINSVRAIIMILRHLGLIQELREPRQPIKYAVAQN